MNRKKKQWLVCCYLLLFVVMMSACLKEYTEHDLPVVHKFNYAPINCTQTPCGVQFYCELQYINSVHIDFGDEEKLDSVFAKQWTTGDPPIIFEAQHQYVEQGTYKVILEVSRNELPNYKSRHALIDTFVRIEL